MRIQGVLVVVGAVSLVVPCLIKLAMGTIGSVRVLAVGAHGHGVHAGPAFGAAYVALVGKGRVTFCADPADVVLLGASRFGVAKPLALGALRGESCGVELLCANADAKNVQAIADRLLSLPLGGEGDADGARLLTLSSFRLCEPVRVADDFQTLVESFNFPDNYRKTIVGVIGGRDVVDGNLVPRLNE